jgi:hypothetical protein
MAGMMTAFTTGRRLLMTRTGKAIAVVTLGIALTFAAGRLPAQSGGENALARRIEGTWLVQGTLVQCDTGAEIPNSTFPALHTFLSGGAMLSNPATSGLSTGHGVWTHAGGDGFNNTIRLFAFTPTGVLMGISTVERDIVLSSDDASLTSNDVGELRDLAGNLVGTRCASVVGTRLD